MNLSKKFASFLLLAATGMGGAGCSRKAPPRSVSMVSKQDIFRRVTVSGKVGPIHKSVIAAPYAGYVQKLYVKIGDRVKKGDPIVVVRPEVPSGGDEIFPMRSPLAGTVVQVLKDEGEYADATGDGKDLVRIDDLSRLVVQSNVPEIDVAKLKEGQEVLLKASAVVSRAYKGRISSLFRAARQSSTSRWDSQAVEFPVTIEVLDADEELRPGMSMVVDIIAAKREGVLALPLEYVEKVGDRAEVTLIDGTRKTVELGLQNEESAEIVSGLQEGDRVLAVDFAAKGGKGPAGPGGGRRGRR